MAEFNEIRDQLRQARAQKDQAGDSVFAARERIQRLAARQAALERVFDPQNPAHVAERRRLAGERATAEDLLKHSQSTHAQASLFAQGIFESFAPLTDPRDAIAQLNDQFPLLLLPVRLETRFKHAAGPATAGQRPQLWVRIYPDDCHIDTFEPMLSEAEITNAKRYWTGVWEAGGVEDQERGAWRVLAEAHGAGRAEWIIANYKPLNLGQKPTRAPLTQEQVDASAAGVEFPRTEDLDIKQHSWSRAPKATLLPDRFVFIGYAQGRSPRVVLGNPVPSTLVVGPDPSAPEEEQLRQDADGEIVIPEDMRWMVDFDRAVEVGMGFRIDLDPVQAAQGFDRVLVVGLRLSADESAAKTELETLIEHHRFSRTGFSLVPQGTPTNNTEAGGSGFTRRGDPDASFDDFKRSSLFDEKSDWLDKQDGQWLAEYLGIDGAVLKKVPHSGGRDQADARAMNAALWPATLGYWMETMMAPVFTPVAVDLVREFFNRYVSGRGAIPAVRIGSQPYGILPATALSRMRWIERLVDTPLQYVDQLYRVLRLIDADWRQMAENVSFAGKPGDAHQTLLEIVGLHAGSVEFSQRYAESAEQMYNRLNLEGLGPFFSSVALAVLQGLGSELLAKLGYGGEETPDILDKFFFGKHNLLKGPVIDDRPVSETEPIRAYTADGKNYLQWLIDAARTSIDAVYAQKGFKDGKPPQALFYLLLRHALQLGYHDVSVRLHEAAELLDAEAVRRARRDEPFLHIRQQARTSESRYQLLYKREPAITENRPVPVGEFIGSSLSTLLPARDLNEQVQALERLKDASTARLERAFAEHVDCCAYRLDAWLLGLVHFQLAVLRNLHDPKGSPRKGIYLGAYAWLEAVRPEDKVLEPVHLEEPDLVKVFAGGDEPPLVRDSANQGYIHAPSLNQAVAAAVLRNGYITNASPASRQTMAVNLTSERVRTALAMIEGIRGGQSLGALLGYQFERGLHDRYGLAAVDKFILDLRKAFPLRGNRLASTRTPEDVSIEAIEARNVMDGLALVNQIKSTGIKTYPFGKGLPPATPAEAAALNAEADRLLETHDAVADLALAEGVYQAVLGNYDAVASTYDAYSKGSFPPEPQVVQTPSSGIGLAHRVGLHLQSGLAGDALEGLTPRAQAEPALNAWLATVLPPLAKIGCTVSFLDTRENPPAEKEEPVTLDKLSLQPLDLLQIVRDDNEQAMAELDDRIVQFTVATYSPRPDAPIKIDYMKATTTATAEEISIFEVMPLTRHLRRLTQSSRPLRPSDLALANEATSAGDAAVFIDQQRLVLVRGAMQTLREDLDNFLTDVEGPLGDLANRRGEIIANADTYIQNVVSLLARAAGLAVPQSGWGFAYDFKRRVFRAVLEKCAGVAARWQERLDEFDSLMLEYGALATDEEKFALLSRAERLISTQVTAPLPALPDTFKTALDVRRAGFDAKRAQFAAIQNTSRTAVEGLLDDANALLPITDFDFTEVSFTAEEDETVRFAEDAVSVVKVIVAEADRRLAATAALSGPQDVKALEAAAKALLGEDFLIIPEFSLGAAQGDEFEKALATSRSGTLFDHLENTLGVDFPVDTWLYGVARVREKMRAWEQVVMLAGAFGTAEPELTALQLPFLADDRWLALEFPPETKLDTDRLLYTAHFASAFDKASRQCGLLLDEWTEVIPSSDATTGITFHYDRPNCEPPQTMLLVTPTDFRGAWQWEDLVDALNETLDLAKRRAVEPVHVDKTAYARFLPATLMAVTVRQLTISANLALNNNVQLP